MVEEPRSGTGLTTWWVDAGVWKHDEETGGEVAMLIELPTVQAGLWRPGRSGLGPLEVVLEHTEVLLVLSGTGRLEVGTEPSLDLAAGRAVRIAAGSHTRWTVSADFSELWMYV